VKVITVCIKVRSSFVERLLPLANVKSATFLHKNLQLFIGYEDPALKTN
jgi:hypothetical protein